MTNKEFKDLYREALIHSWITSKDPAVIARQRQKQKEYNAMYYYKRKNQPIIGPVDNPSHDKMLDTSKRLYDARMKRYHKHQEKLKKKRNKKTSTKPSVDTKKIRTDINKTIKSIQDIVDKGSKLVDQLSKKIEKFPKLSINHDKVNTIKKNLGKVGNRIDTINKRTANKLVKRVGKND